MSLMSENLVWEKVNKKGICLRPPAKEIRNNEDKIIKNEETILDRIKPIINHPNLELIRIGLLAGPKDEAFEIENIGHIKIKEASTINNPRTIYCICSEPDLIKKKKTRFKWARTEELTKSLENAIIRYPNLRFYIDYLLILDKGKEPNRAFVLCEFKKLFGFDSTSEVGIMYYPEKKSLDLYAVYRNPDWVDKGGYYIKQKKDLIPSIYIDLPVEGIKYVEAKYAKTHAPNLTELKESFMIRACDLEHTKQIKDVYRSTSDGKCYEADIESIDED